jgi:hypothetical protein
VSKPAPPPEEVLAAFALEGALQHQTGGISQTVWRVGDVVLKPVQEPNPGEAEWVATALDAIDERGFRVAKPLRATNGAWLYNGWTAWHWVDGDHCRDRWPDVAHAARAFHRELDAAVTRASLDTGPPWLEPRSHRWAQAERTVWHDAPLPERAMYDVPEWALWERARALGPPLTVDEERRCRVVHGDVAGNVLADRSSGALVLIDVSPGWRTLESVDAQIAVEAVAWFGADEALLDDVAPADAARACAFRLLCGFQALTTGLAFNPAEVARFARVLDVVGA